jgi:acyl-coenzyme A thioesterase PaaI-like protein
MSAVPAGFEPIFRLSEYTELIGPLYSCKDETGLRLGIRFEAKHGNSRGKAHGGMISTLADLAMGYNLAFSEVPPRPFLTVNLNVDFLGHIEIGDWVEVCVEIDKKGKSMAFARCEFMAEGRIVARATAVFKTTRAEFNQDIQQ